MSAGAVGGERKLQNVELELSRSSNEIDQKERKKSLPNEASHRGDQQTGREETRRDRGEDRDKMAGVG